MYRLPSSQVCAWPSRRTAVDDPIRGFATRANPAGTDCIEDRRRDNPAGVRTAVLSLRFPVHALSLSNCDIWDLISPKLSSVYWLWKRVREGKPPEISRGIRYVNIFVDVDYTLVSANGSLRPHAREFFAQLHSAGHQTYVWSGMGIRDREIGQYGLGKWISGYFVKPLENFESEMRRAKLPVWPDLVVDDHQEIVQALGGIAVRPYFFADERDRELSRAASALLEYASRGSCEDPAFNPPPALSPATR